MTSTGLTEEKKAEIVRNRYNTLHEGQIEIFDAVQTYHQMYQAFIDDDDSYPWDYSLTDPVVFQLLRNLMARMNPADYKVRLDPTNPAADAVRDINQKTINWEFQEMKKTLFFYRFIFRGLLAGRAYGYTGWLNVPALEIEDKSNKKSKTMRELVNRAYAENVRFADMFIPNRNLPDLDSQPYVIQRVSKRFGEMLDDNEAAKKNEEEPVWKEEYLRKIRESKHFSTKIDYGIDLPMDDDDEAGEITKDDIFIRSQYINILRFQDLEGNVFFVPEEKHDWILNTTTENEFWHGHYPYITWTPFPEDEEFFSQGIVQPVADLQIAISSVLNQFLTNGRMAANPMWVAGKDAKETPDWQFVNRPNGVIRIAGDTDAIQQAPTRDTSETHINMRQELMTSFERATSMSSLYTSGVSGGSTPQLNKTAKGAQIIDSNIDQNMQMLVSIFGAMGLSQIGKHFLELNAQYMTDEQTFKLTGEKTFTVAKPDEISVCYQVVVNPDTVLKANPLVKQAQLMNFKATMDGEKNVKLDSRPIWQALINSFPELDDMGERIIVDPEYQAQDAINAIERGIIPPVTVGMDHKLIIQIVQKYILDTQPEGEALEAYAQYLDEHRKWLAATEMNLVTLQPPAPPMPPGGMPGMIPGMTPQVPGAVPTGVDEQGNPIGNPTADLPIPIPEEEMGFPMG
jgi:hypothetical protein